MANCSPEKRTMVIFKFIYASFFAIITRVKCFEYDELGELIDAEDDVYNGPMTENYLGFPRLLVKFEKAVVYK